MLPKTLVTAAPDGAQDAGINAAKASIHFIARVRETGKVIDDTRLLSGGAPFELRLGKKFLIPSWEEAVRTMRVGETAVFQAPATITPQYAQLAAILRRQSRKAAAAAEAGHGHGHGKGHDHDHEEHGCSCAMSATPDDIELHKLVGTALDFELELVQVEREGSYKRGDWELSWEEKAAAVHTLKESGNAHFKRGDALAAEADYMKALGFLEALKLAESTLETEHLIAQEEFKGALLLNTAACKLKQKEYTDTIRYATMALEEDPANIKGIFRRGQAHLAKGRDLDLALVDLQAAAAAAPDDRRIAKALAECNAQIAASKKKDAATFKGMF
eukprot:gene2285-3995_t